jgi:hypothetical protein
MSCPKEALASGRLPSIAAVRKIKSLRFIAIPNPPNRPCPHVQKKSIDTQLSSSDHVLANRRGFATRKLSSAQRLVTQFTETVNIGTSISCVKALSANRVTVPCE